MKTNKFLLLLAACLFILSASAKDYKYETVKGDPMQARIYTLDNGLKVYLSVNKERPRIQTYIAVRTGSKNDPAETTGLAHYLEHLMFKGTKQFGTNNPAAEAPLLNEIEKRYEEYRLITDPELRRQKYHEIDSISQIAAQYFIPNEYDKLMAAIGAKGTNAYTSNDVTCYTEDIPSNEIDNWAKIQADRFQNMVIRGFHTELEAVYEEYNIGLASDQLKLFQAFTAKLWPNHPYGTQSTIGTQEHLKNPSIVNIKNYFNKWYRPNNVAVCMAGDLDFDKTIAIIDKYFSAWQPGADVQQPKFAPLPALTQPTDSIVIGQEAEQIWLGWRAENAISAQADTLKLMSSVLSNGRTGLFDLDLNQQMKLQGAGASEELMHDLGGFILIGQPKEGQTLDEVKALLFEEIEKLKRGEFSDELIPAIIKNKKLDFLRSLDSNENRADKFVDAFINEESWEDAVHELDRMAKITKADVVAFANKFFTPGYVAIYKKQGIDESQKKIDKPAITPIPSNRDLMSQFVKDVQTAKVEPILPAFVDFQKELTFAKTKKGLPVIYKQNTENDLFNLVFRFEFGQQADKRLELAADYLNYLGTDKYSATELKEKFYQLACSYQVGVADDAINISLSGLNESMPEALALLENFLQNATVDQQAYNNDVELWLKARADEKKNQRDCFDALFTYGVYGPYNSVRNNLSEEEMKTTNPQTLIDLIKNLKQYQHTVLYYGPLSVKDLAAVVSKQHPTAKKLLPALENKPYVKQLANQNEVWLAPYNAKNIYMRMFHNENRDWNINEAATIRLFNEYFGGGMNGIVFQELREARGLAYNASARYQRPGKAGEKESFYTHIISQNDKMLDCIRVFHEILNELPASETAFQISKDAIAKSIASQRTTKFSIINAYLAAKRLGINCSLNQKIYEQLPSLQLSDIVNFEKANMANKPMRYLILGDEKNLDIEALEKIAPLRRTSLEEVFGY